MKRPKFLIAILAAGLLAAVLVGRADAAPDTEVAKLTASDAQDFDEFGFSVALSGDTAVVGAFRGDAGVSDAGAAYVFQRDQGGAGNWGEVKKLTASDAQAGDFFGWSVAISGDTAVVGAYREDAGGSVAGAAYVFQRDQGGAGNWGEVKKLTASDAQAGDNFGYTVAISGDTAVVGAYKEDAAAAGAGAAYVFERDEGGADNWGEVKKLTASDAQATDNFGWSVTVNGDTAVVGAFHEDAGGSLAGAAYVFQRDQGGADNWGEVKKLTASDAQAGDLFGYSVAVSGDTAVVGAIREDAGGSNAGAAYVFQRNQGGADNWGDVKKLTASDAQAGDNFGYSVTISGDTAVVGAVLEAAGGGGAGAAYVFQQDQGGAGNWGEVKKLTASDAAGGDNFGTTVAVNGETAVVGAPGEDAASVNAGAAYVFEPSATPPNTPPVVGADQTPVTVDEGQVAANTGTVSDGDGDTVTLTATLGTVVNNGDGTWSWSFTTTDGPAESQAVTISGDDSNGGTASVDFALVVDNVAPTIVSITVPPDPVTITDQASFSVDVSFTDPAGVNDETYTCDFDLENDGLNVATVTGVMGTSCSTPLNYALPGVYTVKVTVTDKDGGFDMATATQFIVIYDPTGAFVTGGGWIDSPDGACPVFCNNATGRAHFGFQSKYKKGLSVPTGNTMFKFKAGDLNFDSSSYDWLVIAGAKAMHKGVGTINKAGNFGFQLSAIDAALTPSTDVDLFRIRIFDKDDNDALIYDNKVSETDPNADPTTALGGGNIKIHTK